MSHKLLHIEPGCITFVWAPRRGAVHMNYSPDGSLTRMLPHGSVAMLMGRTETNMFNNTFHLVLSCGMLGWVSEYDLFEEP